MKNRLGILLISVALTFVLEVLLILIFNTSDKTGSIHRLALMFGGELPFGIIQAFTFLLFFYGMFEIYYQQKQFKRESKALTLGLLPERENWVLSPSDVMQLKLDTINFEKKEKYFLTDVIKQACNKYRSGKSTSEAMEVVSSTVRLNLADAESEQSLIRYVAWAIPSVGFIGTVIGIAASLGIVKQNMSAEDLGKVTGALYVAFDTTLVALFLSLALMYYFHDLQTKVEKFHTKAEGYVLENLINRIYNS